MNEENYELTVTIQELSCQNIYYLTKLMIFNS